MKSLFTILSILVFTNFSQAAQVAQCLGTSVHYTSPVTAKVYLENGIGKILIETSDEVLESSTTVEFLGDSKVLVHNDNKFAMSFEVAFEAPSVPVQAFREGTFFVEDFYCIYVSVK